MYEGTYNRAFYLYEIEWFSGSFKYAFFLNYLMKSISSQFNFSNSQ